MKLRMIQAEVNFIPLQKGLKKFRLLKKEGSFNLIRVCPPSGRMDHRF